MARRRRGARPISRGRGLDAEAIRRFGLGFAPDGRDALKRALGKQFPEALLIEAGLLRKAEDRPDPTIISATA